MKKTLLLLIFSVLFLSLLAACGGGGGTTADNDEEQGEGGGNNGGGDSGDNEGGEGEGGGEGDDISGTHYQGQSCASCHSTGGEHVFNIGGTVFTRLNATNSDVANSAYNYTIRLKRATDSVVIATAYKGRGTGNYYLYGNISSNFIPEVIAPNGSVVNRASAAHVITSIDCNTCHTQTGSGGAPGRIVNYNYYNIPL